MIISLFGKERLQSELIARGDLNYAEGDFNEFLKSAIAYIAGYRN